MSEIAHEEVLNDSCQAQSLLFSIGRSLFVKLRVNSYFHNCNDFNPCAKIHYFSTAQVEILRAGEDANFSSRGNIFLYFIFL